MILHKRQMVLFSIAFGTVCLILIFLMKTASRVFFPKWHQRYSWVATEYFNDPLVVDLCQAIESDDLARMKRAIANGANVNAEGKGRMTPLLWSYPENRPECFRLLLEHGADPNVVFISDFNTRGAIRSGDSVIHLAAGSSHSKQFYDILAYKGDPSIEDHRGYTAIHRAIIGRSSDRRQRIEALLKAGANINALGGESCNSTPAMLAVGWFGQYDLALWLLENGADPNVYTKNGHNTKLIHLVVMATRGNVVAPTGKQLESYNRLLNYLVEHGQSIQEVDADFARWESWRHKYSSMEQRKLALAEESARNAREQAKGSDE